MILNHLVKFLFLFLFFSQGLKASQQRRAKALSVVYEAESPRSEPQGRHKENPVTFIQSTQTARGEKLTLSTAKSRPLRSPKAKAYRRNTKSQDWTLYTRADLIADCMEAARLEGEEKQQARWEEIERTKPKSFDAFVDLVKRVVNAPFLGVEISLGEAHLIEETPLKSFVFILMDDLGMREAEKIAPALRKILARNLSISELGLMAIEMKRNLRGLEAERL